jgi:hypothetical protein
VMARWEGEFDRPVIQPPPGIMAGEPLRVPSVQTPA